jgi:hypothetical protein
VNVRRFHLSTTKYISSSSFALPDFLRRYQPVTRRANYNQIDFAKKQSRISARCYDVMHCQIINRAALVTSWIFRQHFRAKIPPLLRRI